MKKIIIVCDSLRVGGIQSALKSFIKNLENNYEIDLFLYNTDYINNEIPKRINVYGGKGLLKIISYTRQEAKKKGTIIYCIRIILAILCRILNSRIIYTQIFKKQQKFKDYDIAISFSNNVGIHSTYFGCNQFVISNITAKEKIAWVHVDYEVFNLNNRINNEEYKKFDKIICVSNFVKKQFLKYNKECRNKCYTIENFIETDKIIKMANEKINTGFDKHTFNIICIGRLDDNKNQILQLKTALNLKNNKIQFKWYFIGNGNNLKKYRKFVIKNKLEKNVEFLGAKANPYVYIKNADLLVSTSKSESYGLNIIEALTLNIPVVSMYYEAINEINNNNIIICKTEKEIYQEIKKMIIDKELYGKIKSKTIFENKNKAILKKIKEII